MTLYTIGFTKTTAERFFLRLRDAGVARIIDTRIHRDGQLAGFAKAQDLEYFLKELIGVTYVAEPLLAPTADLLRRYRDKELSWETYAAEYLDLMGAREPEKLLGTDVLDNGCLLCSEPTPARCHRRLAAEYLRAAFSPSGSFDIIHL